MTAPTNLILTALADGIRLNWTCSGAHKTDIYISVDDAAYSLLDTVLEGVVTYDDINDYIAKNVKYKLKATGAVNVSGFSNVVNDILEFVFTSTGDGSGCGSFSLKTSVATTFTIDGTGKFYDDLACTTNERTSETTVANTRKSLYIKVPSGIATVRVKNVVIEWGDAFTGSTPPNDGWDTWVYDPVAGLNCPSVSIDVATMTHNTSINVFGLNTIYGDLTGNTIMTYMEIADGTPNHTTPGHGGATCGGDISLMPLETFDCWDDTHFTGTCTAASMLVIWCNGLNEVTFDIDAMVDLETLIVLAASSCIVNGGLSNCLALKFVQVQVTNTLSDSIAANIELGFISVSAGHSITVPNVTNLNKLSWIDIEALVLTSANLNQILADVWANRDVAKTYPQRQLRLNKAGSGAPTGQGIIDKAALQAYHSPNDDPAYALWTIDTL